MPGRVNLVGIELADLNQFLDLGDADFAASGDHRIEISRCFSVNEVAGFVALPRFHERQLRRDARLEDVFVAVEIFSSPCLQSVWCRNRCACKIPESPRRPRAIVPRVCLAESARVRSSPASTCRSNSLFSPTYDAITFFTCRAVSKTPMPKPSTPALLPTMVRPFTPLSCNCGDQIFRNAAQPESAGGDRHVVVEQAVQRGFRLCAYKLCSSLHE